MTTPRTQDTPLDETQARKALSRMLSGSGVSGGGRLRQDRSGRDRALPWRLLVGRSRTCYLQLEERTVSAEHAVIQWSGDRWTLRDLGSRNGTYYNGRRVEAGETVVIRPRTPIGFGSPGNSWRLLDGGAPQPVAVDLESRAAVTAADLLVLPDIEAPEASIYVGRDGQWCLEQGQEVSSVLDGQVISAGGRSWCLLLPTLLELTPCIEAQPDLSRVTFEFTVSRNEEHVDLTLDLGHRKVRLERREHNYVLLIMARARLADADPSEPERGWIDFVELLKMLGKAPNSFNVSIHRARQQLVAAGIVGATGIVEVRRGERRFGSDRVRIRQT